LNDRGMSEAYDKNEWLTLQEASKITGKSKAAIRAWINRNADSNGSVRVKKTRGKRYEYWLIHKDELKSLSELERVERTGVQEPVLERVEMNSISVEYYDKQRDKWAYEKAELIRTYEQGLMMYRFKFEELDRQIKLLPAPAEVVSYKLEELEQDKKELLDTLRHEQEQKEKVEQLLTQEQEAKEKAVEASRQAEEERRKLESELLQTQKAEAATQVEKAILKDELEAITQEKAEVEKRLHQAEAKLKIPWWKKLLGLK